MKHIVTYTGECFTPLEPDINQIHIEDIAHSLSLLCRANGHFSRFYSIAKHCINCAHEAKARGYTARIQLACLIHDGSEAYISDITRPVKYYLTQYKEIESNLQNTIYEKFLGDTLTEDEFKLIDSIDNDMLLFEFDKLHPHNTLIGEFENTQAPNMYITPDLSAQDFTETETEFMKVYYGIMHAGLIQGR